MLVDRLRNLVELGEEEQARELARAAVRNDELKDVDISSDTVTVTTTHFVGTHQFEADDTGLDSRGTYNVRTDDFTLEFHTAKVPPKVETRVDALVATEDATSDEDADTDLAPDAPPETNGSDTAGDATPATTASETSDTADHDASTGRLTHAVTRVTSFATELPTTVKDRLFNR